MTCVASSFSSHPSIPSLPSSSSEYTPFPFHQPTMEKGRVLELGGSSHSLRSSSRRRSLSPYLATLLLLAALVHLFSPIESAALFQRKKTLKNDSIQVGKLIPTECWEERIKPPFQCYHMYAPLDYLNETDTRTARLAVLMYPAGGGKTAKKDIMGTLETNPGGPGGSGISFLLGAGGRFNYTTTASAMDNLFQSRYNILSWDPRAVGYSTPAANCYKSSKQQKYDTGSGLPRSSSSAMTFNLQYDRLKAKLCANHPTLSDELRFVTTSSTARDMRLLYQAAGDDMLNYWGFSYGTVLGSVFSDMFPEEVRRVVLDGNVDVPNYMAGNWSNNLLDTQDTYEKGFIGECVKAGEKCALNKLAGNEAELKAALDKFYASLIDEPMFSTETNVTMLDYNTVKGEIFSALYSTFQWPNITMALAEAMQGNATNFLDNFAVSSLESSPQAFVAIAGGDALIRREHTWDMSDYKDILTELEKQSEFAGEIWTSDKSMIQTWNIVGKERHFGNYTSHTRHPLLFVNGFADPVTPLLNARKMATSFPNASVLKVKSFGHCSTSQISKCGLQTIADYFVNGTVPKRSMGLDGYVELGKVCDVDFGPWDDANAGGSGSRSRLIEENGISHESSQIIMDSLHQTWKQASRRRL